MTTRRIRHTSHPLAIALGLVAMVAVTASSPGLAQDAGDVEVVRTDFEDGTWGPWTQNGGPSLSVVDVDGGRALLVADRANDYDGIRSPANLLQPGTTYDLTMQVRLAATDPGTAGVRFVVEPAYTWVGATTMSADAWTTVSGTFTAPDDGDPATLRAYLGTGDLDDAPGTYDYLVDDIVITAHDDDGDWEPTPDPDFVPGGAVDPVLQPVSRARGQGNVSALTFDDGPNPGETERLLDFLAANDLTATFCVIGQNITAPGGAEILQRIVDEGHTLCNHTTSYADMGTWAQDRVEADLKANLATIREAVGDPDQQVPYFRAPNGSWGDTPEVAVALGMQPLGLGNVIFDWDGNDLSVETLTANLRGAIQPGAVVLSHDGGGNRDNTVTAIEAVVPEYLADGWTFTLPAGGAAASGEVVLDSDFEDGLDGWVPRGDADGDPTVATTTSEAHGGSQAALVSDRTTQGDGIGHDVTGIMQEGVTYEVTAWVKFAADATGTGDGLWLSVQRDTDGTTSYDTVAQFTGIRAGDWTQVSATYQVPTHDTLFLYLETPYPDGPAASFLVDDVVVASQQAPVVEDRTPIRDTVPFPVGVAVDQRETTGPAAELVTRHFDQLTPENHMKPEAWYDGQGTFRMHPQAIALMDFAAANDLRMYGHTLVWHDQTPDSFFTDASGAPLTDSPADQELLRGRMRTHIFAVAEELSTRYGPFGSDGNPLVAFDVVNEVVSDSGQFADGLRRSDWYRILGEDFIDLAFTYADEAFNDVHAAAGSDRPVTLFINDYNTEQDGKRQRLHAVVQRLLDRGVPVDGVGHQFHLNLAFPVQALDDTLVAFEDLPVTQAVTELDVTTGTPVTQARLVEQGHYYRDAFRAFRDHADDLFSVTVWGLTDGRSWRSSSGAPLLFDDDYRGKPAYEGVIDGDVPDRQRTADVFRGDVALDDGAVASPTWQRLPLHPVGDLANFQLRWESDHLTAWVRVDDDDVDEADTITFVVGDDQYTLGRDGDGDVPGVVAEVDGGWVAVAHLPVAAALADTVAFDLRVTDGDVTAGWNGPGTLGTLTLVEALSVTGAVQASEAPVVDGAVDPAWADAEAITTDTPVMGTDGATATVRTLWRGDTIFVLAEVTDPVLDASGTDPWTQDSVEFFLDTGNARNDTYRDDDTQIRINFQNVTSFGTGDQAVQQGRLESATRVVDGGYVVEAAISLLDAGGIGTFHGFDVQVNDATDGSRTSIRTWADPTGLGYQSTSRWGVVELLGPAATPDPSVSLVDATRVRAGDELDVVLTGFRPGSTVEVLLDTSRGRPADRGQVALGTVVVDADGAATTSVTVPVDTTPGPHAVVAVSDDLRAAQSLVVRPSRARPGR